MSALLVPLLVGLVLAVFAYWLNRERYDVRYTLSDKIPFRFGGAKEEAVQQFDLKNLSRKEVDRIQVKFPPRLTAHEIILNSQGDKVETFTNQDGVEFVYPQLPAQGAFRIILRTPGEGIRRDELSVLHSKGLAQ